MLVYVSGEIARFSILRLCDDRDYINYSVSLRGSLVSFLKLGNRNENDSVFFAAIL